MPAGVTMSGLCIRSPIDTFILALRSATSFPSTPSWPFTHINVLRRSTICLANLSSIHDLGAWYASAWILCITPLLSRATMSLCSHARDTPSASASAMVANVPSYCASVLVAAAARPSILLPSVHSSTLSTSNSTIRTFHSPRTPSMHLSSASSSIHSCRIGSAIVRSSSRCLPYTDAAHLILLQIINLPNSAMLVSSWTFSLLLPLYAPITQRWTSDARRCCCLLGCRYSSQPYVRIGRICYIAIFLLPNAVSLLSRLTISHAALAFCALYFWCWRWSPMTSPRCFPSFPFQSFSLSHRIPATSAAPCSALSSAFSPPTHTPFTSSMKDRGQ